MRELSDNIKLIHGEVARLLKEKKDDREIVDYIVSKGYERYYAETVLDNVKEDHHDRKSFWKTLFYGIGFMAAGLILSFGSRQFSISTGALFYFVFWGMIVTGVSIVIRAFIIFRK